MKKVKYVKYETPKAEEIEIEINSFICMSPDGEIQDFENGGEA